MTDKLTDKDIIKALPNMTYGGHYCAKCKYDNGKGNDRCGLKGCKIARYALDLINRLQAENERLKEEICIQHKIIDERGVEVLRHDRCIRTLHEKLETAKAEAYKECIEKVRKLAVGMHPCSDELRVFDNDLDNLLKELMGENND